MFENIKYDSYPQNYDSDDLPIEYKQRLFVEKPICHLTDNKVEKLNISSIKLSLDNRRYKSNPQNYDYDDLPFDVDEKFISSWRLYQ